MRAGFLLLSIGMLLVATACASREPVCPVPATGNRFLSDEELAAARGATPAPFSDPVAIEIGSRKVLADKVVSGPLCNDRWRGIVYVTCDVKVVPWTESAAPEFLKDCSLVIEPNTVVYVAAHNNAAYYQGCSCHTGEVANP